MVQASETYLNYIPGLFPAGVPGGSMCRANFALSTSVVEIRGNEDSGPDQDELPSL